MIAFLKKPWVEMLFGFLLIGVLALTYTTCHGPKPALSKHQQAATEQAVAAHQASVGADTTKAKAAAASGATHYEAGHAYATVATILHQQSKPHANPTPASDSAATRLQRFLTNY